jgi:hypothetical protein
MKVGAKATRAGRSSPPRAVLDRLRAGGRLSRPARREIPRTGRNPIACPDLSPCRHVTCLRRSPWETAQRRVREPEAQRPALRSPALSLPLESDTQLRLATDDLRLGAKRAQGPRHDRLLRVVPSGRVGPPTGDARCSRKVEVKGRYSTPLRHYFGNSLRPDEQVAGRSPPRCLAPRLLRTPVL